MIRLIGIDVDGTLLYRDGQMPDDAAWRALPVEPSMALVYVPEAHRSAYRIVDLELTYELLMRFNGYFSIAECLDNLIGDWDGADLSSLRQMLSDRVRVGLVETQLAAPPARRRRTRESLPAPAP